MSSSLGVTTDTSELFLSLLVQMDTLLLLLLLFLFLLFLSLLLLYKYIYFLNQD